MKDITIFIDESGTLSDPKDRVVIIAAVGSRLPEKLRDITRLTRKNLTKKDVSEVKFYKSGKKTKKRYLERLNNEDIEIFVLAVEKEDQKIADSPENFALLCWLILEDCLLFYEDTIKEVVFDRHFHKIQDQEKFNQQLLQLLKRKLKITHTDSQKDSRVNSADMIAGSLLWLKTGKESAFYELFKGKVISERTVSWKNLRREFFGQKKSR